MEDFEVFMGPSPSLIQETILVAMTTVVPAK